MMHETDLRLHLCIIHSSSWSNPAGLKTPQDSVTPAISTQKKDIQKIDGGDSKSKLHPHTAHKKLS